MSIPKNMLIYPIGLKRVNGYLFSEKILSYLIIELHTSKNKYIFFKTDLIILI